MHASDYFLTAATVGLTFNSLPLALAQAQDQVPLTSPDGDGNGNQNYARRRSNVVFILTDDQDVRLNSLEYMPFVKQHLIDRGTSFNKHYCTTALCCPSRVNLWTGKAPHNTNVTDVIPPYGISIIYVSTYLLTH